MSAPAPVDDAAAIAPLIDELGDLERELAPLKPKISRVEYLKTAIRAHFVSHPANEEFQAHGERFTVLIGAKATIRSVNVAKLAQLVGAKVFATLASVTLTALEFGVPAAVRAQVVSAAATGSRTLKLFERGQKKAA